MRSVPRGLPREVTWSRRAELELSEVCLWSCTENEMFRALEPSGEMKEGIGVGRESALALCHTRITSMNASRAPMSVDWP